MDRWKNWTRPYHGIFHREGLKRGIQITARFYSDDSVEVYLLITRAFKKDEINVFDAKAEFFGPQDKAFEFGEKLAKQYLDSHP